MRESGFTLVEVLVALVILAVGLVGLAGTAAVAVRTVGESTLRTRAVALASGRREMLIGVGCSGSTGGSSARAPFTVRWSGAGGTTVITVTRPSPRGRLVDTVVGGCGR